MSLLDTDDGIRTQLAIWGYAITGNLSEPAALVAEGHPELVRGGAWDRHAEDLTGSFVAHGDEPYRRVKDWAALPWVGEHLIRIEDPTWREFEWPGL